jgi:flagellar basal-body rod protein FlgB
VDVSQIPLIGLLQQRMSWLNSRQAVLSQNVANADTPGYSARDLKPMDFAQVLNGASAGNEYQGGLMTTNARHIQITPPESAPFGDTSAPDTEANPTGNTVSLEQEMIKVADTQAQYQAAANLYSKAINLLRTAIGRPGS